MDNSSTRTGMPSPGGLNTAKPSTPATPRDPSAADRLRAVAEAAAVQPPPSWRPEVGDELIGIATGWSKGRTRRDEVHPILIVETEEGRRLGVWLFNRVLREKVAELDVQVGEMVLVRRLPDRTSAAGQVYRDFVVAIDRKNDPFAGCSAPVDAEMPGDWAMAKGGSR